MISGRIKTFRTHSVAHVDIAVSVKELSLWQRITPSITHMCKKDVRDVAVSFWSPIQWQMKWDKIYHIGKVKHRTFFLSTEVGLSFYNLHFLLTKTSQTSSIHFTLPHSYNGKLEDKELKIPYYKYSIYLIMILLKNVKLLNKMIDHLKKLNAVAKTQYIYIKLMHITRNYNN